MVSQKLSLAWNGCKTKMGHLKNMVSSWLTKANIENYHHKKLTLSQKISLTGSIFLLVIKMSQPTTSPLHPPLFETMCHSYPTYRYAKACIEQVKNAKLIYRPTYQISFFWTGSSLESLAKKFFTKLGWPVKQRNSPFKKILTI